MFSKISTREQDILRLLISDYIATADPVGSRTIAKKYHGGISPATIRNVMADLTEMGLIFQPHTSAGRMPTGAGMRYYVDVLLKRRDLTGGEMETIRERCAGDERGVDSILRRTSKMLAAVSHYAGLVLAPSVQRVAFKQIQFVPLSRRKLLGIIVLQDGSVQNRLIDVSEELTYPEIERITNYCNRCLSGLTLEGALKKVGGELELDRADYDRLLKKAMVFSKQVLEGVPEPSLVVDGEAHLLDAPEFAESNRFQKLLRVLEEKRKLLHLLERCGEGEGVRIFIGADAELGDMDAIGLVGAPYSRDGNVVGALGVIGPLRMDYSSVVPIVDFTAKVLGDVLEA